MLTARSKRPSSATTRLAARADFPYVHDLRALLDRLEAEGEDSSGRMRAVVRLNQYAVAARYPGVDEPVEYEEA